MKDTRVGCDFMRSVIIAIGDCCFCGSVNNVSVAATRTQPPPRTPVLLTAYVVDEMYASPMLQQQSRQRNALAFHRPVQRCPVALP